VLAALPHRDDVTWAALVLNRKGFDRAVAANTQEIHVAYPVTETFARRNQNMGVEKAATAAG
jgi:(R)-citramalyl-CoA lyase